MIQSLKNLKIITFFIFLALAQTATSGDLKAGKIKSETCLGCHASPNYFNVYPSYHVPKLAGQHPEYIVEALKAYQAGTRNHETMKANSSNLTPEDMADIAAFLSAAQ